MQENMRVANAGKHRQCAIRAWTKTHSSIRVNADIGGVDDVDADADDDKGKDTASASS
jgi:hypothetical protein